MKKETLQKRIEKKLTFKNGKIKPCYNDVMLLLKNPDWMLRPISWGYKYKSLRDVSASAVEGLQALGIDFESGNDAPRGGKDGFYIKLTKKGKKQVAEFANANKA